MEESYILDIIISILNICGSLNENPTSEKNDNLSRFECFVWSNHPQHVNSLKTAYYKVLHSIIFVCGTPLTELVIVTLTSYLSSILRNIIFVLAVIFRTLEDASNRGEWDEGHHLVPQLCPTRWGSHALRQRQKSRPSFGATGIPLPLYSKTYQWQVLWKDIGNLDFLCQWYIILTPT